MVLRAKHEGEVVIFELEGQLDFETTLQFKETCASVLEKSNSRRMVFNLEKLKFVGSSGINQFIRVLKDFNSLAEKPKYCHLSSEFLKIFRALQPSRNPFEIFDTERVAIESFLQAPVVVEPELDPTKKPLKKKAARA